MDVPSTLEVLASERVKSIILVSKNVCHDYRNTTPFMHLTDKDWIDEHYKLNETKRLHDLLMVKEGIAILTKQETLLNYERVSVVHHPPEPGKDSTYTKWGSKPDPTSNVLISTYIKSGR